MRSVFEEYSTKQNIWKTFGSRPLFESERLLIDEYIVCASDAPDRLHILEAGTGSGRIAFRIREQASVVIDAFDLLPEFINQAEKNRQENGLDVRFIVRDATDLSGLPDVAYDVLVYFQQLICHIPKDLIHTAISECARVCKPGGLLLLSYADYDNRTLDRPLSLILSMIRFFRRESLTRQELPYLHTNDHKGRRILNLAYFGSNQSILYWFRKSELEKLLASYGFEVIRRLDPEKRIVYLACRKS